MSICVHVLYAGVPPPHPRHAHMRPRTNKSCHRPTPALPTKGGLRQRKLGLAVSKTKAGPGPADKQEVHSILKTHLTSGMQGLQPAPCMGPCPAQLSSPKAARAGLGTSCPFQARSLLTQEAGILVLFPCRPLQTQKTLGD